jgi:hypothetical protein
MCSSHLHTVSSLGAEAVSCSFSSTCMISNTFKIFVNEFIKLRNQDCDKEDIGDEVKSEEPTSIIWSSLDLLWGLGSY